MMSDIFLTKEIATNFGAYIVVSVILYIIKTVKNKRCSTHVLQEG